MNGICSPQQPQQTFKNSHICHQLIFRWIYSLLFKPGGSTNNNCTDTIVLARVQLEKQSPYEWCRTKDLLQEPYLGNCGSWWGSPTQSYCFCLWCWPEVGETAHIRETRTNWNHLCLSPGPTSATGLTCSRNCALLHCAAYSPGQDPKGPGCCPHHHRSEWVLSGAWPSIDLHSIEKACSFASAFQLFHTFVLCQPWPGDIQEENSGKQSSCLGKVIECKPQEETHRLRVSWANEMYGHPPTAQQLLSPFLLNSELLSGSLPTYLWSFPPAASIPPFSPLQSRRAGQKIFDCEVTERQSLNSVAAKEREKAGEGYASKFLIPLHWNTIRQFRVLLSINAV